LHRTKNMNKYRRIVYLSHTQRGQTRRGEKKETVMTFLAGRSGVEVDGPVQTSAVKKNKIKNFGIYTHDYEQSTAYFMLVECISQFSGES
jgi:hypothetical protein